MRKDLKSKLRIHFVGIKGVGMASLAILVKEAGLIIDGCDLPDKFITTEILKLKKIKVWQNFSKEHLLNIDLLITTGAHGGLNNPEVLAALKLGIKVLTLGQALGEFMNGEFLNKNFFGISVAGCHGKTTTSSILATVFSEAGLNPSFVIGTSKVFPLGFGGHFGKGDYFIAEADEYATDPILDKTAKFMWQNPKALIITNIDFDHPDIYKNMAEIKKAYFNFTAKVYKNKGLIIVNGDCENLDNIRENFKNKIITFGKNNSSNYYFRDVLIKDQKTKFKVYFKKKFISEFETNLMGEHNILNCLAVITLSLELKINLSKIKMGILKFKGSARRLELVGLTKNNNLVFDDYAHHPAEILASIKAVQENYPDKKIILIFQPHTYSRTKYLFDQFIYSLSFAKIVILTEIYKSMRDVEKDKISSALLVNEIAKKTEAIFIEKPIDVIEYLKGNNYKEDYLILILGAGDIYKIAKKLVGN